MREIKFRAWDILRKVMLSNSDIWFKTDVKGYELFCDTPDNRDSLQLMQFVGQVDKNDKEIYEGDICIYTNRKGQYVGIVKWINTLNAFRLVFVDREEFFFISEDNEIIGNIHENPELLEQK